MRSHGYLYGTASFVIGFFLSLWPGLFLTLLGYKAVCYELFHRWPSMPLGDYAPVQLHLWVRGLDRALGRLLLGALDWDVLALVGMLACVSLVLFFGMISAQLGAMRAVEQELRREAYGARGVW